MIHCGTFELNGDLRFWMTIVYTLNHLDQRKSLWNDIKGIHYHQQGPWILLGDFNNVLKAQDMIGGTMVTKREYIDLRNMMDQTDLFEMDSKRYYYTWSNKQCENSIYSRIDRVLGNLDWLQKHNDYRLTVTHPSVSNHAMLCLHMSGNHFSRKKSFKFINSTADKEGFFRTVDTSWKMFISYRHMYVLLNKLQRLKPSLKIFSKPITDVKISIVKARANLQTTQLNMCNDRLNTDKIELVKKHTEELLNLQKLG